MCENCAADSDTDANSSTGNFFEPNFSTDDGSIDVAANDQGAANDNKTDHETCDQANAKCNANARVNATSPQEYLDMREYCRKNVDTCFETANTRLPGTVDRVYFYKTGFVIFRPGRPAEFVPLDFGP